MRHGGEQKSLKEISTSRPILNRANSGLKLLKGPLTLLCPHLSLCYFHRSLWRPPIAIKLTSPGPIFFMQERMGLNKRRFNIFKFRTMVPDAEKAHARA